MFSWHPARFAFAEKAIAIARDQTIHRVANESGYNPQQCSASPREPKPFVNCDDRVAILADQRPIDQQYRGWVLGIKAMLPKKLCPDIALHRSEVEDAQPVVRQNELRVG